MRRLALLFFLIGCSSTVKDHDSGGDDSNLGGDTMEEEACPSTETPLTADDSTPLGFTVGEALERVDSNWIGTMGLEGGGTTQGMVQTEWTGGPIVFVTHEESTSGMEIYCPDFLQISVPLTLSTENGLFAFSVTADAKFMGLEEWIAYASTSSEENLGSHEPEDGTYQLTRLVSGEEETGDVAVSTEGSDGDAAWISRAVVLSWPETP